MKDNREIPKSKQQEREAQARFIVEHWDELPVRLRGRFEGIMQAAQDFVGEPRTEE